MGTLRKRLMPNDDDWLHLTGLYFVSRMPWIWALRSLMTILVEQWHNETSSFHLSVGEATITQEDVWQILQLSIHREIVEYQLQGARFALQNVFARRDLLIKGVELDLDVELGIWLDLCLFVVALIIGTLMPNRRSRGFVIGQARVTDCMFEQGTMYAWGMVVLGDLYQELHYAVYKDGQSLATGVTLLHVWEFEWNVVL